MERTPDDPWPKKLLNSAPTRRLKQSRPRRPWKEDVHDEIEKRGLQGGDLIAPIEASGVQDTTRDDSSCTHTRIWLDE